MASIKKKSMFPLFPPQLPFWVGLHHFLIDVCQHGPRNAPCHVGNNCEYAETAWAVLQLSKLDRFGIGLCPLHHKADNEGTGEYSKQQQQLLRQQENTLKWW